MSIKKRSTKRAAKPAKEAKPVTQPTPDTPLPGYRTVTVAEGPNPHGLRHQAVLAHAPDERSHAKAVRDLASNPEG